MRVKMTTVECGPGGNFYPGDEREVSQDHARQLVAGGHAVIVPTETAVIKVPETAMMAEVEVAALPRTKYKRGR